MAGGAKLNIVPNALRLPQVKIRPTATVGRQNKDCVGNLELHQNGLRFSYIGGASIDILFENVKHIIFQPAVNSIRVIYHITLKKGVEIARKSVDEVQFVADVMESSESVAIARKSYEEEIAAEEREQMRISDTNKQFMRFAQAVEKESNLKTHIPVSNFSFEGVHTKGLTTFKANREVLWAITDRPPLTQRVSEIEVVSLERVLPGGSTFDMSLIFKDYSRPVTTITTIPRSSLEAIKDWCLASRLYYMETTVNPNWKVVLKTILEDPEWDPWRPGAGWAVLNDDVGEDEEDDDDDDDDDDSTYVEESEESDETGSSFLDDEESEPDDSDEEDDESVLSWDELERRAEEQDRKRGYTSDEDDDRPRKRPRVSGPPPAHAGRKTAPRMPPTSRAVPPPRRF
ncbi:putative FACT complex subunit (SPT16 CDC68) like putative Histone chaperone like [Trypanosoma vivax]|nr:putative FACT complex subunit (SPT16 CDC68) like putative Histone chaperone like [Trypanosoma vivax]